MKSSTSLSLSNLVLLGSLSLTATLAAQSARVQQSIVCINPNSTQVAKSGATPNYALPPGNCNPGSGGGGGTGGSGGGTNYALSFSGGYNSGIGVGGIAGRQGPAAESHFIPNQIVVAYTAENDPDPYEYNDQYGDQYVYYSSAPFSNFNRIVPQTGEVFSDANPALVTVPANQAYSQPTLFLAINSSQNPANNYGGFTSLFTTTDGNTWNVAQAQPTGNFPYSSYSPSLAVSSQYLFLGVRNAADNTLTLCRTDITVPSGTTTCTNFPGSRPMNFNPALAYYNNTLYIGYEEYDNTHALRAFTSTDNGQTIAENTNITNNNEDTTSTAPSLLASNNGALYVGFRSNDSGHNFLYKYSTDGINFTPSTEGSAPYQMTSAPVLVQGASGYSQYVYNYYTSNDSYHTLVQNTATQ